MSVQSILRTRTDRHPKVSSCLFYSACSTAQSLMVVSRCSCNALRTCQIRRRRGCRSSHADVPVRPAFSTAPAASCHARRRERDEQWSRGYLRNASDPLREYPPALSRSTHSGRALRTRRRVATQMRCGLNCPRPRRSRTVSLSRNAPSPASAAATAGSVRSVVGTLRWIYTPLPYARSAPRWASLRTSTAGTPASSASAIVTTPCCCAAISHRSCR